MANLTRPEKTIITAKGLFSMLQGEKIPGSGLTPRESKWPEFTTVIVTTAKGSVHAMLFPDDIENEPPEVITTTVATDLLRQTSVFFDRHIKDCWTDKVQLGVITLTETLPFHWNLLMDFIYGGKILNKVFCGSLDFNSSEKKVYGERGQILNDLFFANFVNPQFQFQHPHLELGGCNPTRLHQWKKSTVKINRLINMYILADFLICADLQNELMDELIEEYELVDKERMEQIPLYGLHDKIISLTSKNRLREFLIQIGTFHTFSREKFTVGVNDEGTLPEDVQYMTTATR